ncbi:hypothetical protein BDB01DRAFT_280473 [Pilobolus umbonatus]|nr:hypothetical protein BDB01DRAFT_280473 [Pilobolus umbonatus]
MKIEQLKLIIQRDSKPIDYEAAETRKIFEEYKSSTEQKISELSETADKTKAMLLSTKDTLQKTESKLQAISEYHKKEMNAVIAIYDQKMNSIKQKSMERIKGLKERLETYKKYKSRMIEAQELKKKFMMTLCELEDMKKKYRELDATKGKNSIQSHIEILKQECLRNIKDGTKGGNLLRSLLQPITD